MVTAADGKFEFGDVPRGAKVRLVFEKTGFRSATRDLVIDDGTQNVSVELQHSGPPPPAADASFDDLNRR